MPETTSISEVEGTPVPSGAISICRRRRLLALGLVLSVSFARFIVSGFYYLFQPEKALTRHYGQLEVFGALLTEFTALFVLWFVMTEHKHTWAEIGWSPEWRDLSHGIVLIAGSGIAARTVTLLFQAFFYHYTGHYLQARAGQGVIGAGFSALMIVFVFVNPVFEELVVRGYTMSEIMALGGSRELAILLSVVIQMSYHVYQGLLRCIGLTVVFLIFSIYFSRTRKIGPVILAHLWSDALALIRMAS